MRRTALAGTRISICALTCAVLAAFGWAQDCATEHVSVNSLGQAGSGSNYPDSLSFDGRIVGFTSNGSDLVPDDWNGKSDAFVRDRELALTERISVSTAGIEGNDHSGNAKLSDDGRYALFVSWANNFDPRDTDHLPDLYVRDRSAHSTQLVSVRQPGIPTVFGVLLGGMSGNGRFVVFSSQDMNLVPQPDTNGTNSDVFLADRLTGTIEMLSLDSSGIQATLELGSATSRTTGAS